MSSEHRVVRPYRGLDAFQQTLESWRLRVGPELIDAGERANLTSASFLSDPVVLVAARGDDELEALRKRITTALEDLQLEASEASLLIVARNPYLRLADVVHERRLDQDDAIPREIPLSDERPRALQTPSGGCDIDVYLLLADHVAHLPLRPQRKGTWLGHVAFRLRTELGELGFTPRPLTHEARERLELPTGTIRFVAVETDALENEALDDVVSLYVDEEVLAVLNQSPNTPAARFFQRQLFLDVVGAIVRHVDEIDGFDDLEVAQLQPSVLRSLIEAAAGKRQKGESDDAWNARRATALHLLKHERERFLARIEDLADPRADLRVTIAGLDR